MCDSSVKELFRHGEQFCTPQGEMRGCIGYSEPNAGSALASLKTRCVDSGDHRVINGWKVSTSRAQSADGSGIPVHADGRQKARRRQLRPGHRYQARVETRPIKPISGSSPFCETFFADAVAPKDALPWALNKGGSVGERVSRRARANRTGAPADVRPAGQKLAPIFSMMIRGRSGTIDSMNWAEEVN
jgi:alkylation response protein AidB-like acyl-CoA dehydrogenase